ncbi:MAG: DUF5667 domain-containing protein [Patescibacteria group bacterium]|nr:hypothetical protein [Patescibacteria group bacterium]
MKNLNSQNSNTVADLISLLENLNKQKLEIMDEGSAKSKIWAKIEPHVRVTSQAQLNILANEVAAVSVLEPSAIKKAQIREVVMEYIESVMAPARFFFGRRFVAAAASLTVLFFALVPNSGLFPAVSADKVTHMSVEQGEVEVMRGGSVFAAEDDMVLLEGDVLKVADGSLAQVFFMDDSRMALAPGAEVYLKRLYVGNNDSDTQVEIEIDSGKAWVQVLNLFSDEDYFSVWANGGEFKIDRAGDLNVEVSEDHTAIQVISNLISFKIPYAGSEKTGILGEGTQMTVNGELVIEGLPEMTEDVWWSYNLAQNHNHISKVTDYYITESAKKVRFMPGDPLWRLKQFKETVTEVVSFDTKVEKSLKAAGSRLAEAEQLVQEGDDVAAHEKLNAYIEIVEEVVTASGTSLDDMDALTAHIGEVTKALTMKAADNEGLAVLQDAVNQVDESASGGQGDKSITRVNNASNKLSMALSFVNAGSYDVALEYLRGYSDELTQVVKDISDVPANDRAFVVSSILDRKIENLQILKIIIEKLENEGLDSSEVDEMKGQVLFEMNALVVSLKERAITKLTDFLSEVQSDENIQVQVLSNLKKSVPLDFDLMQKINDVEEVYFDEGEVVFLVK